MKFEDVKHKRSRDDADICVKTRLQWCAVGLLVYENVNGGW